MQWKRGSSLGRESFLCGKVNTLCAQSVAAGAGMGVGMVEKVWCTICVGEGPWKEGGSAGAERSGRSVTEMNGTSGKMRETGRCHSDLVGLGCLVWVFLWGMCFRCPLTLILETYWDLLVIMSPFADLHPDKIGLALLFSYGSGNHCSRILALPWHCALYSVCSCSNAAVTFSPHLPTCTEH